MECGGAECLECLPVIRFFGRVFDLWIEGVALECYNAEERTPRGPLFCFYAYACLSWDQVVLRK